MATFAERLQSQIAYYRSGKSDNKLTEALYTHWFSPLTPINSTQNFTKDLLKGYMDSEIVYSIINKIADTASSIPIQIVDKKGDVVESHWAMDVLANPNEDTTLKELIYNYYVYLLSIGNSYIYAPKLERGTSVELWTMPSDLVLVVSGNFMSPVSGYKLIEGNQEILFEKKTEPTPAGKELIKTLKRYSD